MRNDENRIVKCVRVGEKERGAGERKREKKRERGKERKKEGEGKKEREKERQSNNVTKTAYQLTAILSHPQ